MLTNKTHLITGDTGSLGNTFVPMTLAKYNPKKIIIFLRDEMKQWDMAKKFEGSSDNTRCQNPARINCGQKIASDFIYCSDNNIA